MNFHYKSISLTLWFLFFVSVGWNISLYFLPTHETTWNFVFNALYATIYALGGIVAFYSGIGFGIKSNLGKMLLCIGGSQISYAAGLFIWLYYNLKHIEVPYPSNADIAFLIFYPLIFMGTIYILAIYKTLITKKIIRDAILICIGSILVVFYLHSRPDFSSEVPLFTTLVNIAYPLFDMIILSIGLIAVRIGGGNLHPSFSLFSVGLLLQVIGDLVFDYRTANDIYWNGDISDSFFVISGFILSMSILKIIQSLNQVAPQATGQSETNEKQSIVTSQEKPVKGTMT